MNKYNKIGFVNGSAPPLNADNLNHMDEGIERATDGVTAVEEELKTAKTDLTAVKSEVETARGEYESVGERLDNLIPDEVDVITTEHMRDGAVKTLKIADAAVTQSKLSADLKSAVNSIANKADTADVNAALALKADKSTTLDGYGITDAYTKDKTNSLLKNKLDSMPFDSEPQVNSPCYLTSGTVYNALSKKFDSSNVEYGKGTLSPAQAVYEGSEGNFNYSKIGKTVTVALNVTALTAGKSYVQLIGLPYRAITASRLSSVAVYTTTNKLVNLRIDGTWLYISTLSTAFAEGEKVNAIITYIIG